MTKCVHRTSSPEVRLDFIQNEYKIVFTTECLQQLQVFFLWMIGATPAQIRLCNNAAPAIPMFIPKCIQLLLIWFQINRLFTGFNIVSFGFREADESYSFIAFFIFFASGNSSSQTLLTMEAMTSGNDHIFAGLILYGSP